MNFPLFFFLSGNRGFAVTVALTCSGAQRCKDATTYSLLRRHLGLIKTMTKACARFYSGRSNLNLTVGAELGNSATPLGQSWTLMRMWGGQRPSVLLCRKNTACDCFTLKWTNLWRGKFCGPPRDLGVLSLYEVPSSLSLAMTLFAIERKCTCGCYELLHCFDVMWGRVRWNHSLVSTSLKLLDLLFFTLPRHLTFDCKILKQVIYFNHLLNKFAENHLLFLLSSTVCELKCAVKRGWYAGSCQ